MNFRLQLSTVRSFANSVSSQPGTKAVSFTLIKAKIINFRLTFMVHLLLYFQFYLKFLSKNNNDKK